VQELIKGDKEEDCNLTKHSLDEHFESLKVDLGLADPSAVDDKAITAYFQSTVGCNAKLQDVWKVDSKMACAAFKLYQQLSNHKLLWHGEFGVRVVASAKPLSHHVVPLPLPAWH
jgi:hypothetical protein